MAVKMIHYWSIIPERNDEYVKFVINKFIPGVNGLGMSTVAVWSLLIGAYSDIVFETASNDLEVVEKALTNKKYKSLKQELFHYVYDYKTRVLVNTGKVDSFTMDVRQNTIKFNQMWDIRSDKKDEYEAYSREVYFPALIKAGVNIAGEWDVLIGDGPGILVEGRVSDICNLISNLQDKPFHDAKKGLLKCVKNYHSRVLTFHIQKLKGYKSESYQEINA